MRRFSLLIAPFLFVLSPQAMAQKPSPNFTQQTLTAAGDITITLVGTDMTALTVQATGTATLTTAFQVSDDGVNYVAQSGFPLPTGSSVTSTTGSGYWIFNVAGHRFFQVHTTAVTGTETFTVVGSMGGNISQGSNTGGGGGGVVTNAGTFAVQNTAATPAGTNIIGKVGIDQTTPGTTNGVSLSQVGATTILTGAGATGAGSPRDTVAQDTTTIAGSAPGVAGTPSTNVITIQGAATGTPPRVAITTPAGTALSQGFNAAAASTANGIGVSGVFLSTPPALTNSQAIGLQLDALGNLLIGARAITPVVSTAAENNHVLKGSAGTLLSVYATNQTATAGFLVVINATTAPADGAITPLDCVPLPANGYGNLNYNPGPGVTYSTGIVAVLTSAATCFTKTTGVITGFIKGAAQ